jgi:hypothetical protein
MHCNALEGGAGFHPYLEIQKESNSGFYHSAIWDRDMGYWDIYFFTFSLGRQALAAALGQYRNQVDKSSQ